MNKLARLPAIQRARRASARQLKRLRRPQARYFAFLSYSHKDDELAEWLHSQLEQFRVPHALAGQLSEHGVIPRRLTPIFRDQHELAAADDLGEEIEEALAHSRFLIVLCSPAAAKSRWTNAEIETFKRSRPDGCVLAAIAAGEPFASEMPGREDEECFPPALKQKYDRRGHPTGKRAEPLAADLREQGEAQRVGLMKLIAGMLGVGLDDLLQRETTRRQRRLAYVAAASLAGMAITSTLAITAIQARNEAREQRREAEGLVAFMVGDLRDKLEPIGKLDVLDGVGSRVLAYYSKQNTSELSDDALVQRSRALNLMAEVAYNRGNLEEAEGLYQQAVAGTAEAVRRAPNDAKRLYDHAQNVFYVGEVARFAGRPRQSESAYREYKRIADRLSALEPDNLKYRMEVLYANEDVGISLYDQHRFTESAELFENALAQIETLASLYPANIGYQKEAADAVAWVAEVQRAKGKLEEAIATRQRQISALERLMGQVPGSDIQARLITAHEGLGVLLSERGQFNRAVQEFQSALDQAGTLIAVEPRNAQWRSVAADARFQLANALLLLGKRDEAAEAAAAACGLTAALPATFAISASTRLRTNCAMMRARIALAGGATGEANVLAQQALASARIEHNEDPETNRSRLAQMYRIVGDARQRAGDVVGAKAAWASGLSEMPENISQRPWEMSEHAALLRRLGRSNDAAPIAAALDAMGYQSPV